jgi:hypothetical protein
MGDLHGWSSRIVISGMQPWEADPVEELMRKHYSKAGEHV